MGLDEEGTLAAHTAHRSELIEPSTAEHRERVVKMTGDGLLAEFASAVDGFQCAADIRTGMAFRNRDYPEQRCNEFRMPKLCL
jgi:adenylate cyclase